MARDTNKTSRPMGLIVLVALLVVSILLTTVWYRESSGGPIHTTRKIVSTVTSPILSAGHWVFSPLTNFRVWASSLTSNNRDAKELKAENEELRASVMTLEESRLEAERLRELLDLKNALEMDSTGARIIGTSVDNWNAAIKIDKGATDGIEEGMPVVTAQGLVGKVVETSPYASTVQLIEDSNSGVAAMIQSSRAEGIITGIGTSDLHLNFVSRDVEVKPGDVVITSGMGGIFPKGVVIGEVTAVDPKGSGVYQSITVKPAVSTAAIEEVLVITGFSTGGASR